MTDTIDVHAKRIGDLQKLRNWLAYIPYAARHQAEIAEPLAKEIEAAYQADELPDDIRALWAEHRVAVNAALARAVAFADEWDGDFPVFKTRPVGE